MITNWKSEILILNFFHQLKLIMDVFSFSWEIEYGGKNAQIMKNLDDLNNANEPHKPEGIKHVFAENSCIRRIGFRFSQK